MNNKGIWIGAVIFILGIIGICMAAVGYDSDYGHSSVAVSFFGGSAKLRSTTELTVDQNTALNIACSSDNLVFYENDSDKLLIKEYYRSSSPSALAAITESAGKVNIENFNKNFWLIGFWIGEGDRIEIYLPKGLISNLQASTKSGNIRTDMEFAGKRFALSAGSGNITWNQVKAEEIFLQTLSGNIRITDMIGDGSLEAGSGNIKVMNAAGDVTASVKSGNITIDAAQGYVTANTSSGNIKILNLAGGARAKTSSGNSEIEVTHLKDDISARATSGNVKVRIPRDSQFTVQADTTSGNINTAFDEVMSYNKKGNSAQGSVGSNPKYHITVQVSSGNVNVNYN